MENIDYDVLKRRGFLRQRQEGFFVLRTQSSAGNYTKKQLLAIAEISGRYARGMVHATTRQGLEIPFIKLENIESVERAVKSEGIQTGASGPRIRAITCCPGNNWCKRGLIDTFSLYDTIKKDLRIRCGMDLPHKFKIAISGCPNKCTRAQSSDIGIHGQIDTRGPAKKAGYAIYIGGCGGTGQRTGFKIGKIFTLEETLHVIENVVRFYKKYGKARQRLGALIEEFGKEKYLRAILKNS